jgi:hypothetical protein
VAVVDGEGQIVLQEKITTGGIHRLSFQPAASGTYCLFVKALRYAYKIKSSSSPWIIATGGSTMSLYQPAAVYVKAAQDSSNQATFHFSVDGDREGVIVHVYNQQNQELAHRTVDTPKGQDVQVDLAGSSNPILRLTFEPAPKGKVEDVKLTLDKGLLPYLASSSDAPFPAQ